jgi:hypothetical protein
MAKGPEGKSVRNSESESRTHYVKLFAAWLIGSLLSFPAPGTTKGSESFFLTSYQTALELLDNSGHLGEPLLESAYDALHLYETCARSELSGTARSQAAQMLNDKLTSPRFARAYQKYKKSGQRTFSAQEAKNTCSTLAKNIAN